MRQLRDEGVWRAAGGVAHGGFRGTVFADGAGSRPIESDHQAPGTQVAEHRADVGVDPRAIGRREAREERVHDGVDLARAIAKGDRRRRRRAQAQAPLRR